MGIDTVEPPSTLTPRLRRRGWFLATLFVALAAGSRILPHLPLGSGSSCPINRLTGIDCPGCGMTRACVALFHGELAHSVLLHPFGVLLTASLGFAAAYHVAQNLRGRRFDWAGRRLWQRRQNLVWMTALALLLAFSLARYTGLWPAPGEVATSATNAIRPG